ncbi:glyoxalase [Agromyces larvae]|uniref:Glyoxalase n=1 Tax=Agromyces larvae TaxID=2929802 RepID=A0ABY4BWC6_9MICO|nr:glyoxalase [Agromyces larvae]UOE43209.1 glyoxalase [Agromyces larvae]
MDTITKITSIDSVTLEATDPVAAERFYAEAFGLGERIRVVATDAPTSGFRGYTLSLTVSQPGDVRLLVDRAVAAGATVVKPVAKNLWGVGATVQAPDGAIWKVATTTKKDSAPATGAIDSIVLLLGADDVPASKRFYVEHGLVLGKSFGSYAEFDVPGSPIKLGLYKRRALAKDAGVDEAGTGSHRIRIGSPEGATFTDPDGFVWGQSA